MAEATTRELLDAGELVAAARREAAFAHRGGYETTATLLARMADALEDKPSPARELPTVDISLLVYGKTERGARVYVDASDLALWLSAVLEAAPEGEQWIVGRIRDEMREAASAREGSARIR